MQNSTIGATLKMVLPTYNEMVVTSVKRGLTLLQILLKYTIYR